MYNDLSMNIQLKVHDIFRPNAGLSVDEELTTDRFPPYGCQDKINDLPVLAWKVQ